MMWSKTFQDWWMQMEWPQGTPFPFDDPEFEPEEGEELQQPPGKVIEAPLLPLRDMVMFPRMVTPLFVGR
ncbi:MAG: hypothetical protein IMY86_11865, partial [Chloroflexi bacterium]|nr:hypothetical protein [Chloroflexota bacterium]